MRNRLARRNRNDFSGDQAESLMRPILSAFVEEHLVADADAQSRFPSRSGFLDEFGRVAQGLDGVSKSRHARQDQAGGTLNVPGITAQLGLTTDVPQGVADAFDVAHIVVDDDNHRASLSGRRGSRQMRIINTVVKEKRFVRPSGCAYNHLPQRAK